MTPTAFTAEDSDCAYREWGSNCGPGALAGMLGLTLAEVRPHIPDFEARRYTSPVMMNAALRSLGVGWRKIGRAWPRYGLVRIQWSGPWMERGAPFRDRYPHSHWIGIDLEDQMVWDGVPSSAVFDINCMGHSRGWVSYREWERCVVPWLLGDGEETGVHGIMCAIELDPPPTRRIVLPLEAAVAQMAG